MKFWQHDDQITVKFYFNELKKVIKTEILTLVAVVWRMKKLKDKSSIVTKTKEVVPLLMYLVALVDEDVLKALVASDDYKPNEVSYRPLSDRLD